MKRVRYTTLEKNFGPARSVFDKNELILAHKENRLLTIHHGDSGGADFGVIGGGNVNVVERRVFAKTLPRDVDEVVGIKW